MSDEKSPEKILLDKLLAERTELDQLIAILQKRLDIAELSDPTDQTPPEYSGAVQPGDFDGFSRPQATIALLRKVRRPISTNEIFELLKKGGQDMSGKNAFNALYTALSRTPGLRKVAPNTWGLESWYNKPPPAPLPAKKDEVEDEEIPF
jgi:hypothetical protein